MRGRGAVRPSSDPVRGRLDKEVQIAKASATLVRVPLQADFRSLGDPLGLILSGLDLNYKIEGAAVVKATLDAATIPFSKSEEIEIKKSGERGKGRRGEKG